MKIVLVSSPVWSHRHPSLSLATLQAALKKSGHNCRILDLSIKTYNENRIAFKFMQTISESIGENSFKFSLPLMGIFNPIWSRFATTILEKNPDVICFSVFKTNFLQTIRIAKIIKKRSNAKLIFGGPATYFSKMRNSLETIADEIIVGEGETKLLTALDGKKHTFDISKEPVPDFDGLDLDAYSESAIPYSSTRGCYDNCAYCFDTTYWKSFRFKKAEKVVSDIEKLTKKHKRNRILFSDSVTLGRPKNIERFCDLVLKKKLKIRWGGQLKAHGMSHGLLEKMVAAGCDWVSFGIESGSQKILDKMCKKQKISDIERTLKDASDVNLRVIGLFMVGYPDETWNDFMKTLMFLKKNRNISIK